MKLEWIPRLNKNLPILHISSFEEGMSVKSYKMILFLVVLDQFFCQISTDASFLRLSRTLLNIILKKINFPFLTDLDNPLNDQNLLNVFCQRALTYLLTV